MAAALSTTTTSIHILCATFNLSLSNNNIIINCDTNDSTSNNNYDNARRQQLMQYACGTILRV